MGQESAEQTGKAKTEARAGKISLLREALVLLEEIANAPATTREQGHPLNENRPDFLASMKPVLAVLGREGSSEKGVTPATDAEIATALSVATTRLAATTGGAYKAWERRIKEWQHSLKAS